VLIQIRVLFSFLFQDYFNPFFTAEKVITGYYSMLTLNYGYEEGQFYFLNHFEANYLTKTFSSFFQLYYGSLLGARFKRKQMAVL
jgi:hypothetical protein